MKQPIPEPEKVALTRDAGIRALRKEEYSQICAAVDQSLIITLAEDMETEYSVAPPEQSIGATVEERFFTIDEAMNILGLTSKPTEEEVIEVNILFGYSHQNTNFF